MFSLYAKLLTWNIILIIVPNRLILPKINFLPNLSEKILKNKCTIYQVNQF